LIIWRFTYAKTRDSQPALKRKLRTHKGSRFIEKNGSENLHRANEAGVINLLK
jgi:hypothetical protein